MLKFLAVSALAVACLVGASGPGPLEEFAGTLEIFEHSAFRSTDGEVYSLRIEGEDAKRALASKVRASDKSVPLCLGIDFTGELLEGRDFVGRQIIAVTTFHTLEVVACGSVETPPSSPPSSAAME